ncbi:MAG: flagellar hook-length control protein [Massilia sp.]|nr:MAG: flagellar hook-length control protein [Massilia sp.]
MSIAMTAVIAPSRCLRCLLAGFGASLFAAACAVGLAAPARFTAGPVVAAALLFAAACVARAALRTATVHRIDISGPGQIRLTVQQGVRQDKREGLAARLLPGSTLWPRMLLLRLETGADGVADSIVVLPDSLPPEGFRTLAVALGAAGGAPSASSPERKIL